VSGELIRENNFELNPYRPDVPSTIRRVSDDLYEFLFELALNLRTQHNLIQAGDTTYRWEILTYLDKTQQYTLGSIGRFLHPKFGMIHARYCQFKTIDSQLPNGSPIGILLDGFDFTWTVTNRLEKSNPVLVLGLSGAYEPLYESCFGWVICGGTNIQDLIIESTAIPAIMSSGSWTSSGKAGLSAKPNSGGGFFIIKNSSVIQPLSESDDWIAAAGSLMISAVGGGGGTADFTVFFEKLEELQDQVDEIIAAGGGATQSDIDQINAKIQALAAATNKSLDLIYAQLNKTSPAQILSDIMPFIQEINNLANTGLVIANENLQGLKTEYIQRTEGDKVIDAKIESLESSVDGVDARVAWSEGIIRETQNRTRAFLQETVQVGSALAFVNLSAQSDVTGLQTSNVALGAQSVSIYSTDAAGVWHETLVVSGARVVMNGDLQVLTQIRQGSGAGWPVALKPLKFQLADGESATFPTVLDSSPIVSFGLDGLDALGAGEVYSLVPLSLSGTGFTLQAKIITPAAITLVDLTTMVSNFPSSAPKFYISRGAVQEPISHTYEFTCDGVMAGYGTDGTVNPGVPPYQGQCTIGIWAKVSGVWSLITTTTVSHTQPTSGLQTWSFTQSFTLPTGLTDFGISTEPSPFPYTGSADHITHVKWSYSTPSSVRTATPAGQKTTCLVSPQ
jgi:hypothetical protein